MDIGLGALRSGSLMPDYLYLGNRIGYPGYPAVLTLRLIFCALLFVVPVLGLCILRLCSLLVIALILHDGSDIHGALGLLLALCSLGALILCALSCLYLTGGLCLFPGLYGSRFFSFYGLCTFNLGFLKLGRLYLFCRLYGSLTLYGLHALCTFNALHVLLRLYLRLRSRFLGSGSAYAQTLVKDVSHIL